MSGMFSTLFEGLSGFQILLAVLGTALFVLMFVVLAYRLFAGKKCASLIPFFLISILMIGYSSVKKIEYDGLVVEINAVGNGTVPPPSDPAARAALAQKIALVESRAPSKATQVDVARAYLAIGDTNKAYDVAQRVNPSGAATEFSPRLAPIYAAKLQAAVPQEPTERPSASQQQQIATLTKQLENQGTKLTPEQHVTLARGYLALDKKEDAVRTLEAAKRVDPNLQINPKLQGALQGTHM